MSVAAADRGPKWSGRTLVYCLPLSSARGIGAALLITAPVWTAFLLPALSLWQLYDGEAHLLRAHYVRQLIADGNWLPRWMPQEYGGYGYPTLNFYAPGMYYAMVALAAVPGLGLYGALQLVGGGAMAGVVAGAYLLGERLWRSAPAALICAVSIGYAPYLLGAYVYVSGGVPAVLGALGAIGLVLTCHALWDRMATGRGCGRWWWVTVALTTSLLLTHNISALLGGVMAGLWLFLLATVRPGLKHWRQALRWGLRPLGAACLGAALAAFFWVPALLDAPLVQLENLNRGNLHFRNHFLAWPGFHSQVWGEQARGPWTPGFPIDLHLIYPHSLNGPPRLGLWQGATWVLAIVALAYSARTRARPPADAARPVVVSVVFGLLLTTAAYAQMFDWALPLWERFPPLRAIQLPSRLLGPAVVGLGIAAGGAHALFVGSGSVLRWRGGAWLAAGGAALVLAVTGLPGRSLPLDPTVTRTVDDQTSIARERAHPGSTESTDEFLPRTATYEVWHEGEARGFWLYDRMFPDAGWLGGRVMVWTGDAALNALRGGLLWTETDVEVAPVSPVAASSGVDGREGATLAFHQLAFPGWRAWIDGTPVPIEAAPQIESQAFMPGFILVHVPPGAHRVTLRFDPDGPRLAGALVTVLAVCAVALLALRASTGRRLDGRYALLLAGGALLVAAVTAVRTLMPLLEPRAATASHTLLHLNIADEVLAGRASISSPSGAALGPDRFVDVHPLRVVAQDRPLRDSGQVTKRWLYAHPPTAISVELSVPPDGWLQTSLAIDPAAWDAPLGDGVRFTVALLLLDGPGLQVGGTSEMLSDTQLNPRARGEQRRWIDQLVDLRPWTGRRVRLTLATDGLGDPSYDWAGWGEPAVVRLDALTAARMADSAARIAEVALRS